MRSPGKYFSYGLKSCNEKHFKMKDLVINNNRIHQPCDPQ